MSVTEHIRKPVVCPSCGKQDVICESKAVVSQKVWLVYQPPEADGSRRVAIDWDAFESDDVEFDEGVRIVCLDCQWETDDEQVLVSGQPPLDQAVDGRSVELLKRIVEEGLARPVSVYLQNEAREALEEIIRRLPPAVD
jgi:hypothetical protein